MRIADLRRGFPSRSPTDGLPVVIGRGVLPSGERFVVVQTLETWAKDAAVELLHGDSEGTVALPTRGRVWGSIGRNLVRVMVNSAADARQADYARLDDAHEPWRDAAAWLTSR